MATTCSVGKLFNKSLYFFTDVTYALFYKMNIDKFNMYNPMETLKMCYYAMYYFMNPRVAKHLRKSYKLTPNMAVIERYIIY